MTAKLIAIAGPTTGEVVELERTTTTIGRDPDNQVVIEANWISRRHCRLEKHDRGFRIQDLGSHNGTAVNGVPVKERDLVNEDRITLAGASFLYVDPDAPPREGVTPLSESSAALELDDTPLAARETVQLNREDALFLRPESLGEAQIAAAESARALATLLKTVQLLSASPDPKLPDVVLIRLFELVPAERGAILMGSELSSITSVVMRKRQARTGGLVPTSFAVSRTVLNRTLAEGAALIWNGLHAAGDEHGESSEAPAKSLLRARVQALACLPLVIGDDVRGAIYLDSRDAAVSFDEAQLDLLVGLASVAGSALDKARELGRLRAENRRLQEEGELLHDMVGESPKLANAQSIIARVAPTDTTVLIQGESGTGKELAARAIHANSDRRDKPLVKVDCTSLNENLLASELFGHEKGAFTGAIQQKKGKLEVADSGTVFLDEIGELPLALQSQLLRVLQDREFERVGGTRPIQVDIRLVAATNRNLKEEVEKGAFREDLFYRLNVVTLELPPLRERTGDVELLARYFVSEFSHKVKRKVLGLSSAALDRLARHPWPGNVRELANTIERAVVLGTTEQILPEDLPEALLEARGAKNAAATGFHEAVAEKKRQLILDAVAAASGNITEAAKALELHPNYLHRLIRNLDLRNQLKSN